jgi:catechol 2,3-dioxygenase-like lactoylglutathione lyase family enzyme
MTDYQGDVIMRAVVFAGPCLAVLVLAADVSAQLIALKDGPVVMGHVGLNATSTDEHKKFWSALGGKSVMPFGDREMFEFPNIYVSPGHGSSPKGGTVGTTVNHLGFRVPDLRAVLSRMEAAGYPSLGKSAGPTDGAFLMGPDGIKIELIENRQMPFGVAVDHIHYVGPNATAMRDWYVKVLDARPGRRGSLPVAELPGIALIFQQSDQPVVGTVGRVIDHVSFEIRDLGTYCDRLQTSGIKLDRAYTRASVMNLGVAFLTDPWGTAIELTEGYDKIAK